MTEPKPSLSRRDLLALGAAGAAAAALPRLARGGEAAREVRLTAARGRARLVGPDYGETDIWCYGGTVPGPLLRLRQGERLRARVTNRLKQPTTVHWHGIRLPNAMDGVPQLTQPPIAPGGDFTYEFDLPDAGTYWYHPHERGNEQVARGLAGALIVEESEPIRVDREAVWVLDDWRLDRDARIVEDFDNFRDIGHAGRIGNTVTLNGELPENFALRAGERIRLRLINVANARVFGLRFEGHRPRIIALDGQPVTPHDVPEDGLVLGPAMRADLILDAEGAPGQVSRVIDGFYRDRDYRLIDLAYTSEPPLRDHPLDAPLALAPNTMPEPDLKTAGRHDIVLEGGMMSRLRGALMDGERVGVRDMMRLGKAWSVNGVAATGHAMTPILTLERGRSYVLTLHNHTPWQHPMHLHGHSFRVISRNGRPTAHREWLDTVFLDRDESAEIAFVADNPGDWLFHCHVLEHMQGGMMSVIRVT